MEAAEERSLIADSDLCQQAQAILTNPRRRLEAELSWFPGTSPKVAEQAASSTVSQLSELPLGGLAMANALVAASSGWTAQTVVELRDFLDALTSAADQVDVERVIREVNEDREIAGFPMVTSMDVAAESLRDRRQAWRRAVMATFERVPTVEMAEAMFTLVDKVADEQRFPRFLHEVIDDYAVRSQSFLAREIAGAERLVEKARELAATRPDALPPIIDALKKLLVTWDELTHPVQISATLRGQRDEESEKLAFTVRSLSIDLYNDHSLLEESQQVSVLVGSSFSALPRVASKIAEDAQALDNLSAQAAQEDAELAYAADVGTFSKTRLSIDRDGVEWRGRRTRLSAIRGVRWGAIRKSVNGVPTGTDYLIAWNDGVATTTAEFRNGAIFEAFVPRLWQGVGFRLMNEMMAALGAGGELTFGKMVVRNETVVLTQRKMFSSERVEFGWGDVTVRTADGSFIVEGPKGSKASETMGYREIDNIHFFEALVRQAFKNGRVRLSEAFA
ncbi:MAG: hypothetical protein J0I47_06240 [Sphingomonas sp.]|nr:hypothetical protein [Sphingomonas sp.]